MLRMKVVWVGVIFMLLLSPMGCAFVAGAAVAGAGIAYMKGEGEKLYSHDVPTVYRAALDAVHDKKLVLAEHQVDATSGIIKAKEADGDNVTIKFEAVGDEGCNVKIRVGLMGNESDTRMLFSAIDKRL